jgi:hypothetical protein
MTESEPSDTAIEQLTELERQYREKQHDAVTDGDAIGGAYFSGHVSALIRAQEVLDD